MYLGKRYHIDIRAKGIPYISGLKVPHLYQGRRIPCISGQKVPHLYQGKMDPMYIRAKGTTSISGQKGSHVYQGKRDPMDKLRTYVTFKQEYGWY